MQIVFVGHSSTYFYFQDYVESLMAVSPAPARVEMYFLEKNISLL